MQANCLFDDSKFLFIDCWEAASGKYPKFECIIIGKLKTSETEFLLKHKFQYRTRQSAISNNIVQAHQVLFEEHKQYNLCH